MTAIALVTHDAHPALEPDDEHLVGPLAAVGLDAVPVPWGAPLDPARFALALLRSPWDYFHHVDRFLEWCGGLEVPLVNAAPLVRWNAHKGYLLDLARVGAATIPPTRLVSRGSAVPDLGDDRLVIKPAVSGGAYETYVLDPAAPGAAARVAASVARADTLVQRFEPRLVDEGEWSLMFMDGAYTHAVRKRPRRGDFRVQAEHGGSVEGLAPPPRLVADAMRCLAGTAAASGIRDAPLYARVDGFEGAGGELVLVELELIEPELFLRASEPAARALAAGVRARIERA